MAENMPSAPFPWEKRKHGTRPHLYRLVDAEGLTVVLVPGKLNTGTGERAEEIADYVLRACSSHKELLEALAALVDGIDRWNQDVEKIIGRQPNYEWGDLEKARRLVAEGRS